MEEKRPQRDNTTLIAVGILTGLGFYIFSKIGGDGKGWRVGENISARVSFTHRGRTESMKVGFGFGASKLLGYSDITGIAHKDVIVGDDQITTRYEVVVDNIIPELPGNKYDVFVFLVEPGKFISSSDKDYTFYTWYDDYIKVDK